MSHQTHTQPIDGPHLPYHGVGDIKNIQIFLQNHLQIKAWITTEHVHGDSGYCRIIYQSTPCEIIIVPQKNWPAQKTKHFELGIGAVLS